MVHQDPAHHPRRHGKKVRAVLPGDEVRIHQPDVCLVDKRRRLKAVFAAFSCHAAAGDPMKLLMDERNQMLEGGLVASCPSQ